MEQIRLKEPPRHRLYKELVNDKFVNGELVKTMKWVCEDRIGEVFGIGNTAKAAYDNCWVQYEILTSDIHQ